MSKMREKSERKLVWANIIFFAVTTIIAVIGTPLYLMHHSLNGLDWALFLFYIAATGMSITVGYHRLFAHRTFKASPLVEFLVLFFGAAAFEQSALKWAAQHRDHHQFVDTDEDPYSIKKGFWYAHIGWLIFWRHPYRFDENAKDLKQNKMLMHQHRHYYFWAASAGIGLPLLIGALTGHLLASLIFTVCLRLTLVYHTTFCINSVCHMFGTATYDINASAKDHWFVALLTFGEGYHNFHHRFPSDYRNGIRWYHWDPSKWTIAILSRLGLAKDLKKVSEFSILDARLVAEKNRAKNFLDKMSDMPMAAQVRALFEKRYERLRADFFHWKEMAAERQKLRHDNLARHSKAMQAAMLEKVQNARVRFKIAYERWARLRSYSATNFRSIF